MAEEAVVASTECLGGWPMPYLWAARDDSVPEALCCFSTQTLFLNPEYNLVGLNTQIEYIDK